MSAQYFYSYVTMGQWGSVPLRLSKCHFSGHTVLFGHLAISLEFPVKGNMFPLYWNPPNYPRFLFYLCPQSDPSGGAGSGQVHISVVYTVSPPLVNSFNLLFHLIEVSLVLGGQCALSIILTKSTFAPNSTVGFMHITIFFFLKIQSFEIRRK